MANSSAFISAMALAKMPSLMSTLREMEIPSDVTDALRVFAGEDEAIESAVALAGIPRKHLIACVEAYIRAVLLYEGAPQLRVLGLKSGDDQARMRLHRKLLLARLHPDKSSDADDAALTRRVLEAWKYLTQGDPDERPKKARRKPFTGPRIRWIRVPIDNFPAFGLSRLIKRP